MGPQARIVLLRRSLLLSERPKARRVADETNTTRMDQLSSSS